MKSIVFLLAFTASILFSLAACTSAPPTTYIPEPEAPQPSMPVQPSPNIPPSVPIPSPLPSPAPSGEKGEPNNTDTSEWIDLGVVRIPAILSHEEVGLHGEIILTGDFLESHDSAWGDTWMFVGMLMGDFESLLDSSESFTFDDGHIGIYTETFDLNTMGWIREDGNLITLHHGGDISMFTDNEELIMQIVRSLK